jgi:small subunit ribosomal protein S17
VSGKETSFSIAKKVHMEEAKTTIKRIFIGEVVSDKMEKTIVVKVEDTYTHPQFHKILYRTKKYKVHDEQGVAQVGDVVEFYEGKPASKTKFMYLSRVVRSHVAQ